jgi:APA family basic amino acid/polyamine antiporter
LPLTVGALVFVAGINLFGLRLGAQVQNLIRLAQAAGGGSAGGLRLVSRRAPGNAGAGGRSGTRQASASSAPRLPVLFAYSGFTYLNNLAGEVRDPQRTLPRALLLGMLLVIAAYAGQRGLSGGARSCRAGRQPRAGRGCDAAACSARSAPS